MEHNPLLHRSNAAADADGDKTTIGKLKDKVIQVKNDPQHVKERIKEFAGCGGAGDPEAKHQDGKTGPE
ncbi:uncharacterized protein VTP21DRAFT_4672 [Calcarisporiella thermophila]|uniref:uncharacterized protein n=1 Tax=Calcarisporiella thermophila TaxID=911321 RepID=UPI0037438C4F